MHHRGMFVLLLSVEMVRPGPVNALMQILGNEQDFYITMNSVTESQCVTSQLKQNEQI